MSAARSSVAAVALEEALDRSPTVQWVPVSEMRVSDRAQANYNPRRAEAIAAKFNVEGMGYPVVNHRGGRYWIVDGQHRVGALKLIGYGDQKVECEVYEGLTEKQEGILFLLRNTRREPQAIDKFRVAVFTGRDPEVQIQDIVDKLGLKIVKGQTDGTITAVSALIQVYNAGGSHVLTKALDLINRAYGGNRKAFVNPLIVGMGKVIQRYGADLNEIRLIERLAKMPGGVNGLISRGNYLSRSARRGGADGVAAAIVDVLNTGRGVKKLDPWWE